MTITAEQYFAGKPHDVEHEIAASDLLARVRGLRDEAERAGIHRQICPNTGSEISGSKNGSGDGGFRLPGATTGAPLSSHKEARGVDIYDPHNLLDNWIDQFDGPSWGNSKLEQYGLYREAPAATPGWVHLTTRKPRFSGRRTFEP